MIFRDSYTERLRTDTVVSPSVDECSITSAPPSSSSINISSLRVVCEGDGRKTVSQDGAHITRPLKRKRIAS